MTTRVYKSAVKPLVAGPQGMMQYDMLATADTKAEAARLAGISPEGMEWCRDAKWVVHRALADAGLLGSPGELFLTGATRGDAHLVYRMSAGDWIPVGRMAYGSMFSDPRLDAFEEGETECQ